MAESRRKEYESVKLGIHSLISTVPDGLPFNQVVKDYKDFFGKNLEDVAHSFGYFDALDMLLSFGDTCFVTKKDNRYFVKGVIKKETADVQSLIHRTKSSKKPKQPVGMPKPRFSFRKAGHVPRPFDPFRFRMPVNNNKVQLPIQSWDPFGYRNTQASSHTIEPLRNATSISPRIASPSSLIDEYLPKIPPRSKPFLIRNTEEKSNSISLSYEKESFTKLQDKTNENSFPYRKEPFTRHFDEPSPSRIPAYESESFTKKNEEPSTSRIPASYENDLFTKPVQEQSRNMDFGGFARNFFAMANDNKNKELPENKNVLPAKPIEERLPSNNSTLKPRKPNSFVPVSRSASTQDVQKTTNESFDGSLTKQEIDKIFDAFDKFEITV